jgi:hypothetical protein
MFFFNLLIVHKLNVIITKQFVLNHGGKKKSLRVQFRIHCY